MRAVIAIAGLLVALPLAAPALAHGGHAHLILSELIVSFNPLTQAQEYEFTLRNNDTSVTTNAVFASVTAHDNMLPTTSVKVTQLDGKTANLKPGDSIRAVAAVPLRVAINGCIFAFGTGSGSSLVSDQECAMTNGITQVRVPAPEVPEVPTSLVAPTPTLP